MKPIDVETLNLVIALLDRKLDEYRTGPPEDAIKAVVVAEIKDELSNW